MTGLVHISEYLNAFKVELDNYEKTLTEKAEEVSLQVKEIQKKLSELGVEPFHIRWEEEVEGDYGVEHCLGLGLSWSNSKMMFLFEDDSAEAVLGTNRQIRVEVGKRLDNFLEEGLKSIRKKTEELLN